MEELSPFVMFFFQIGDVEQMYLIRNVHLLLDSSYISGNDVHLPWIH